MHGPKHTPPTHVISLNEHIQCFELAGYECCQNLAGIAVDGKIVLGIVRFPVGAVEFVLNRFCH